MRKIRCIAIDDEPMALEKLSNYIQRIPYFELVGVCESVFEAKKLLKEDKIDAMFIDINMPDVNGLDFVKSLTEPPMVVFTTAHAEYAVDSYKVRAVDYLLKPYGFDDFHRAASNIYKQYRLISQNSCPSIEEGSIYLKVDYRYIRVKIDDIVFIEGMNEYLKVHIIDDDPLLTHSTFKCFNECLPAHFLQVHRSFVVNMKHLKEIERSVILMTNGAHITISDSYKEGVMHYLQLHSIKK